MPEQKPKPRKAGRPKLPKGDAKDVYLRVRISPSERKAIEAAAKARKQSVSDFVRGKLIAESGV